MINIYCTTCSIKNAHHITDNEILCTNCDQFDAVLNIKTNEIYYKNIKYSLLDEEILLNLSM